MNCIPEKENLLLAYRDKFTSIQQTHPEWSNTDIRLQTAADLRPQFRLNRDAGYRENLGLSEYEVPEAAFTLTEDGSVWYTKYRQGLLELHERQLRLMPDTYSPEEHAISRLAEEHFKQGATSVVTSYGDRDLVVMHFDPITKLGTTKIIDATKQQSTVQEVAKKRYAHFESLHLTEKIFLFTDKKLSMQHATEVMEPIMKQRMKTKLRFNGVQETKHIQPPFYKRLFASTEDSFIREEQIPLAKNKPFIYLPLTPVIYDGKRPSGWVHQKKIWDTSVRPWIIFDNPMAPKETIRLSENSSQKQPHIIGQHRVAQAEKQTKQEDIREDVKPVVSELPFITQETVLFQRDAHAATEGTKIYFMRQEDKGQEDVNQMRTVLPLTTFVKMIDMKIVPKYEAKFIAIALTLHRQIQVEQTTQQYIPIKKPVIVETKGLIKEEQDVTYEVDQLMIVDMQTVTESIGKQIKRGESDTVVTKLVWMMLNEQLEFFPVEEVEIAQDSTRTLQNLLHFLRKVVPKYVGDDVIRQRVVQRIASDKWDDEIGETEEYLTILKTHRMYNHLFAVVN